MLEELKEKLAQKVADLQRAIENMKKRENELSKTINALQDNVASCDIVGFEGAKDLAVVLYPSMDLSDSMQKPGGCLTLGFSQVNW